MRACLIVMPAIAALFGLADTAVASHRAKPDSESYGYSHAYDVCMNSGYAANGVTEAIRDCATDEIKRQDERLNTNYRAAMARLTPARQARLRAAERAWIRHRERHCEQAMEAEGGGTMALILGDGCFLDETARRATYLSAYR